MKLIRSVTMILCSVLIASTSVSANEEETTYYEVTITNLTRGQSIPPILVASHKPGVKLFTLGTSASPELITQAESGNPEPLTSLLMGDTRVIDVANSALLPTTPPAPIPTLLAPGASVTVVVNADGAKEVSLSAMMIPTNDGFIALNGVKAPVGNKTVTYLSPAYDAGSEDNDEECDNIPGPVCMGFPDPVPGGGEGYVHIHAGIHGILDLAAATYDWRNPVAKITITRTN